VPPDEQPSGACHAAVGVLVGFATLLLIAALFAVRGASDRPAYCASLASLGRSVKALPTTDMLHNGL
jgi:hypothetical protein